MYIVINAYFTSALWRRQKRAASGQTTNYKILICCFVFDAEHCFDAALAANCNHDNWTHGEVWRALRDACGDISPLADIRHVVLQGVNRKWLSTRMCGQLSLPVAQGASGRSTLVLNSSLVNDFQGDARNIVRTSPSNRDWTLLLSCSVDAVR